MRTKGLLILTVVASVFSCVNIADAASQQNRCVSDQYNCRMRPQSGSRHDRDRNNHGRYGNCSAGNFMALFGDMRLSGKQRGQLEKAFSKYDREMRKIYDRMRNDSHRNSASFNKSVTKCENKFISEVSHILDRRQYLVFERRFRNSCGGYRRGNSAPRPGAYVCAPAVNRCGMLADSMRQECAGEQECILEMRPDGIGKIVKGPEPKLMTGESTPD